MNERIREALKELDLALNDRHLTDGDGTVDQETLRLMELRIHVELAAQIETLNRRLTDVTQMIRAKF
jgi:hypothetical protein